MESDNGKLFIGGLSWDTNANRLREYFSAYGEVVEAVIIKNRTTGLSRCFGFVVFADSTAAERVLAKKHKIDGFVVEAKQAIPRDDLQAALNRPADGSPGAKIFVCGLASTVTKSYLRGFFKQFGTITNSVVACDFNTRSPRGFGFVTYDSEDAVDKVLLRGTFHKLKGKTVEVKRSVPKKLSAGTTVGDRSPIVNFSHGNNSRRYSSRMDPRRIGGILPSPVGIYTRRTNIEEQGRPNLHLNYNESMNYGNSILTHGRGGLNPPYLLGANSTGSRFFNSVWGSGDYLGGRLGVFGGNNNGTTWDAQIQSSRSGDSSSGYVVNIFGGGGENDQYNEFLSANSRRRIDVTSAAGSLPAYSSANAPYERGYQEIYGDTIWRCTSSELDDTWSSFDFDMISNHPSDAADN